MSDQIAKSNIKEALQKIFSYRKRLRAELMKLATDYSDLALKQQLAQQSIVDADGGIPGIVKTCAAFYGSALAGANVEDGDAVITPEVLNQIGRQLIECGECLYLVGVSGAMRTLEFVSSYEYLKTRGDRYQLEIPRANGTTIHRYADATDVVHIRYDCSRPFTAQPPVTEAMRSLARKIETAAAVAVSVPSGQIVSLKDYGRDAATAAVKINELIAKATGSVLAIEQKPGFANNAKHAPPSEAAEMLRFNPHFEQSIVQLREQVEQSVIAACQIPPQLVGRGSGAASGSRESMRTFIHRALMPLAKMITAELANKLDLPKLKLDFSDLMMGDISVKTRGYKQLIDAGMQPEQAARIIGFEGMQNAN